ncbi:nucleoid occlusion protein [Fervidibacillus albus]|uniref:Nucleoid occlusion protein n=1 Tax=Fervidibacillus albus TaxID=2980026 RepID=A0A9E8RVR2_9BACI|nr:nucleoid occlusion protein [Fervidibacillus albus]WAA09539.1 nucleoid occlusion protein [Fervidibacillus albus]
MKHPFSRFLGIDEKDPDEKERAGEKPDLGKEVITQIPISRIRPNRYQPRTIFDEEKIHELAKTIHTHGIIQPIVVRKVEGDFYEIIAGERRFRAVKTLDWETVPAIIRDMNDKETASMALIENLQREELSPIEEAIAYQKLIDIHGLTQEALAQRLGKGQSTVANKLRLLKLPEKVQEALLNKEITERHARALIPLKDANKQQKLLEEIIEKHLNVKQTEKRVEALLSSEQKQKPKRISLSRDVRIAVNTIRQSLVMVNKSGIDVDSTEEEMEDFYQITIRIPKKKT